MLPNATISLQTVLRRQNIFLISLGLIMLSSVLVFSIYLMTRDFIQDQKDLADRFGREADEYLDDTHALLDVEASMLAIQLYDHSSDGLDIILQDIKAKNPRFDSLYMMDASGIVRHEATSEFSIKNLDFSNETYFSAIANYSPNLNDYYITDPFISIATGEVSVIIAHGLWDMDGVFEGMLAGVLNLMDLQGEIDEYARGGEVVFIVDQHDKYVAHPNSSWVQEQRYYRSDDPFFKFNEQIQLIYEEDQGGWNIRSHQTTIQGWKVIVLEPVMNILWPLLLLLLMTLGISGIGFFSSYWNYRRMRYSLSRDLDTVVARLDIVSRGDYQQTLPRSDAEYYEIQAIYDSFARMVNTIIERDKTLEQRVAARTAELEVSNQELESFAYSVSHDLRAPLRAIKGFTDFLYEDYGDILNEEANIYVERISENSERMDQLIKDLLQLSRVVQLELERKKFDLGNLAYQIFHEIQDNQGSRPVGFEAQQGLEVEADQNLVRVMLINLLSNAYKFTKHNELSKIRLGAYQDEQAERRVYFLEDNGIGFDMTFVDKIFDPFQRLHSTNEFEGTGIGLAIVSRIVKRHGGQIWVKSIEGEGTTFFFTLGE